MGKIEIARTELVWPGKYNEDGTRKDLPRVSLPFQVIETVNESRATREAKKGGVQGGLFDVYDGKEGDTFEAGWRNKLIWGDNLLVMGSLLEKFAGKIDIIYIDPPFATGIDFSFTTEVGDSKESVTKEQSVIEEKAYRDTWGQGMDSYITMLYWRLSLMRDLLSSDGTLYVHCDYRVTSQVKLLLDEIFGVEAFRNELVWQKTRVSKAQSRTFGNIHDTLWVYSKGDSFFFEQQFLPHDESYQTSHYGQVEKNTNRRYGLWDFTQAGQGEPRKFGDNIIPPPKGKHWIWAQDRIDDGLKGGRIVFTSSGMPRLKRYLDESKGRQVADMWTDIFDVNSVAEERTGYATQKPEALLSRVLGASSRSGVLVADFFCGSGTTLAVAEKLGRRWIGCDLGRWGIHVSRKRLLGIENCKPFEVLNLGKYERQYWQGVSFGGAKDRPLIEQALYEYFAFILKLYGAQPVAGLAHLHGKKGKAMVHIGAVDAPVTIDEINAAIAECVQVKQSELHILGWEWEMGLYDLMAAEAKKKGIKLLLLQIPREVMEQQAVDKGDVKFFELAYLEVQIKTTKGTRQSAPTAAVTLKDFVIPNTELIPEEVRSKVKKWSDYIDYWAVDWNFQNDTFMQGWVTYRTRKDRTLALTSDPHTYEKPGKYRILVKVVDIFGNDTSQAFDMEV